MDELGKIIPAGEGMIDAEQGGENKTPNEFCLNCGPSCSISFVITADKKIFRAGKPLANSGQTSFHRSGVMKGSFFKPQSIF
jgi:hypothetical protein